MSDNVTSVADIPTLNDLYAAGKIAIHDDPPKYKYDEKLNERISIWRGNIVKLKSDVIVNAANKSLLGGGGVDGAIHRAAGPGLLRECETLGGAETGETKFTKGYELPSKYVAHTVGPVYAKSKVPEKAKQLESCYRTALEGCRNHGGGSIGFSSISTGVYGYPIVDATRIALETTRKFLEKDDTISRVIYVVFSEKDEKVYRGFVNEYFPGPPPKASSTSQPTVEVDETEEGKLRGAGGKHLAEENADGGKDTDVENKSQTAEENEEWVKVEEK